MMENNYNLNNVKNLYPYSDLDRYQTAKCGVGVRQPTFVGTSYTHHIGPANRSLPSFDGSRHYSVLGGYPDGVTFVDTPYQLLSDYSHSNYSPLCISCTKDKNGQVINRIERYNVNYTGNPNSCYKSSQPLPPTEAEKLEDYYSKSIR